MNLNRRLLAALILTLSFRLLAQTEYVLTEFPIAAMGQDTVVKVQWAKTLQAPVWSPDSGDIYFSRTPQGSSIENRTKVVVADQTLKLYYNETTGGLAPRRRISFRPSNQTGMGAGVYYYIVAWVVRDTATGTVLDTSCSNELQMIIESDQATTLLGPTDTITDLTPTFTWEVNPGVPYYHLILSDEKIGVDSADGEFAIEGLSIVWQAITPNTQIVYGAPDPSGTITASPPPMSPGQTYSVVVLNNYGNHAAYTSTKFGLPKTYTIKGDTLKAPVSVFPIDTSMSDSLIRFKWTNLDKERANTYKVYIYVSSDLEGVDAQMVLWDGEVTAGTFGAGSEEGPETGYIDVDAKSVLTENHYTWKVIAVDDRGAGRAGDTTSFDYTSDTGVLRLLTRERIITPNDTIVQPVAAVELQVDVLDGSLEKPLLFYTDNNGYLSRDRPKGTYRVTAVKEGFEQLVKTYTVKKDTTTVDTLYLNRPDATVFGNILGASGVGVDLAAVLAVSERGDSVYAETDRYGSFVLSCYGADWEVWAQKTGYIASTPQQIRVSFGESYDFGVDTLHRVPYALSGKVVNADGNPIIGVNVKLSRGGRVVDEVPSTSQTGEFSFSIQADEYELAATKTGFTTVSRNYQIAASKNVTLIMTAGAAVVKGAVMGRSWVSGDTVVAPITNAKIYFALVENGQHADTVSVTTHSTYGTYSISLPGNDTFAVWSEAIGYAEDFSLSTVTTRPGVTQTFNDRLRGFAMVQGVVNLEGPAGNIIGQASGVTVTLVDTAGDVVSSATSGGSGDFELRGIPDGTYTVSAGSEGLELDSVAPAETLTVTDGDPSEDMFTIDMVAGYRIVNWNVTDGTGTSARAEIKIQSPLLKSIDADSTLTNASGGKYVVVVDAAEDSLLDLSYHTFDVVDTVYTDSVSLPVVHTADDSLTFVDDSITLVLRSAVQLDSARLYYRDVNASEFLDTTLAYDSTEYQFRISPSGDGRDLIYYFRAYASGSDDVYGYSAETFRRPLRPNLLLSKLEIIPSSDEDTLTFPANYEVTFRLRGYYSSAFVEKEDIDSSRVAWTLNDQQDSYLDGSPNLTVTVRTGSTPTGSTPARLQATLPSGLVRSGVDSTISVLFHVASSELDSISIRRIDPGNPNPITTAPGDKAEFAAEGLNSSDTTREALTITPQWRVIPAQAGTITDRGTFTPSSAFAGQVRIVATAGDVSNEYNHNPDNPSSSGIAVQRVITRMADFDTMDNYSGCRIVFPPNVVGEGETGLLELSVPELTNPLELKGDSSFRVIGTAYDIEEVNGVTFTVESGDSIMLTLLVPDGYGEQAVSGSGRFVVGYWDADSLLWYCLDNSEVTVSDTDTLITAPVAHFSRYAVLLGAEASGKALDVSPNPFSPYMYAERYDATRRGTRISFGLNERVEDVKIRIYNVLGDLVWAVYAKGMGPGDMDVWWNGKTSDGEIPIEDWNEQNAGNAGGERMCRNGRYFVVLIVKNMREKQERQMQSIILMK